MWAQSGVRLQTARVKIDREWVQLRTLSSTAPISQHPLTIAAFADPVLSMHMVDLFTNPAQTCANFIVNCNL